MLRLFRSKTLTVSIVSALVILTFVNKMAMVAETSKRMNAPEDPTLPQPETTIRSTETVFDGIRARVFPRWNLPIPCFKPETLWKSEASNLIPTEQGLLMTKCVKSGSTTAASVQIRIAEQVAKARNKALSGRLQYLKSNMSESVDTSKYPVCRVRFAHAIATSLRYDSRSKSESFLWTVIRDPTRRAISHFFFEKVSRRKEEPIDSNFQEYVLRPHNAHHFLYFLSPDEYNPAENNSTEHNTHIARRVMEEYDFIGLMERMDESIVALQLILGLETRDVLHLSSKTRGSFDAGGGPNGCTYIVPSFLSDNMKDFFYNTSHPAGWSKIVSVETALHKAVNASLDLTIESLGRRRFQKALQEFKRVQSIVKSRCDTPDAYPCSTSGAMKPRRKVCTISDMGCGSECIDGIADELDLPEYEYRFQ